ncbi:hypothetical protein CHS0354_014341 [Potamilus streckersoni]|uniref:Ig-like domain-containing protein n=1 Tax=Potamilus streckersoni TaxID=2493646 RepID=A0AAE0SKW8_9BIVA|nr:hypothetical protein CHS0354_014341 [Potamilus streckersoni]
MMRVFIACYLIVTVLSDGQGVMVFKVKINRDIDLPCTVRNQGNDVVKWYKNKKDLISVNNHVQIPYETRMSVTKLYDGEWNLNIKSVLDQDAGNYTCKVGKEVISHNELVVETPPDIHETQNMTFDEGDTGTLWCNATGSPSPTVRWYWKPPHQDDGIEQDSGAEGNKLVLHNMTRYYDNIYVCLASNSVGKEQRVIRIRVKFGPEVVIFQNTIITTNGQEVTLHCAVEAFPMDGDLEWAFQNKSVPIRSDLMYEVRHDRNLVNDFNTLFLSMTIRKDILQDGDYGRYVCRTINFSRGYSENVVIIQKKVE